MRVIKLLNDQGIEYTTKYIDLGEEIKFIFDNGNSKVFPKKFTHENRNYEFNFKSGSYQPITN